MNADLARAVQELREGKLDAAIADLEALADKGVAGTGVAFDRGLAYASRARSNNADRSASHAFRSWSSMFFAVVAPRAQT